MARITVRYFAGAAEAAGCESETLEAEGLPELREAMLARHGDSLAAVLDRCSLLVDGVHADAAPPLVDGARVDVLPPFAGG